MKIGLIKRGIGCYEDRRFIEEIKKVGEFVKIVPQDVCLLLDKKLEILHGNKKLDLDVAIPRFASKYFNFGLILVKHLEKMGIPLVNNYDAIINCRNKYFTSLVLKKKGIPQPKAAIALSEKEMMKYVSGIKKPAVLKLLDYSFGYGVARINDDVEAEDWFETVKHFSQPIYVQEYVNHPGEDYRLFVVGDKVVGAMKRIAKKGWKANFHLGGLVEDYKPDSEMKEIAIKCCKALKADVVGVDLMIGEKPEVIEVNQFPGFKGLERATGKNICREVVKYAKKKGKR